MLLNLPISINLEITTVLLLPDDLAGGVHPGPKVVLVVIGEPDGEAGIKGGMVNLSIQKHLGGKLLDKSRE